MMHRPIGAQSHRPLATVDVFELLSVICRKSTIVIFNIFVVRIRPTACYRPLRRCSLGHVHLKLMPLSETD